MKKLFAALLIMFAFTSFTYADLNIKGSLEPFGFIQVSGKTKNTDFGFTLSADYMYSVSKIIKVGGGLQYLMPGKIDFVDENYKFSTIPIYISGEINPFEVLSEIYFKLNIGTHIKSDIDYKELKGGFGGFYVSCGGGYQYKSGLQIEIMYSYHSIKPSLGDFEYNKLGINIGYRFDI